MIPPKGQMMMVQQLQLDLLQQLMMDHNASHVFLFYGSIIPVEPSKLITYTMGRTAARLDAGTMGEGRLDRLAMLSQTATPT